MCKPSLHPVNPGRQARALCGRPKTGKGRRFTRLARGKRGPASPGSAPTSGAPPASDRPDRAGPASPLGGAKGKSGNEVLLHEKEHDDGRHGGKDGGGGDKLPVAHILPVKRGKPGCDGFHALALGKHGGPEIVVPHEGEDKHGQRGDGRAHKRQHKKQEDAPLLHPVDARRLDKLEGKRLYEVAHEQRAKAGLEGGMEKHKPGHRVVEPGLHREVAHGHHENLEGDEIAGDEHEEKRQGKAKAVQRQRVAGKTGKRNGDHDSGKRDRERVEEIERRLGARQHLGVVRDQLET